jgi:hypothetical protein
MNPVVVYVPRCVQNGSESDGGFRFRNWRLPPVAEFRRSIWV